MAHCAFFKFTYASICLSSSASKDPQLCKQGKEKEKLKGPRVVIGK